MQTVSAPRATSGAQTSAQHALVILLSIGATPDALSVTRTETMLSRGFDAHTIADFLGDIR